MMMQQVGDIKFANPVLPPSREVFLELQVHQLIKDLLFTAGKDDKFCSAVNDRDVYVEGNCSAAESCSRLCNGVIQTFEPVNICHQSNLHVPEGREVDLEHANFSNGTTNDHYHGNWNPSSSDGISAKFYGQEKNSMQENKVADNMSQLSRLETFPQSKIDVHSMNSGATEVDFEVKPSFRKPPLPPRPSKLSNESNPALSRCISDTGLFLKSTRKVKSERRRRVPVPPSTNTPIWALVFTICFAVLMIGQGFWSQGSQVVAFEGSSGLHPVESAMKVSLLNTPQESNVSKLETKEGPINDQFHLSKLRKFHARRFMDFKEFDSEHSNIKGS